MTALSMESLAAYWSLPIVEANIVVFFNLLGALLLGLLVGYERSYHGRAAGMRTYGLVCLASSALTVIVGYPELWFGGHTHTTGTPDVTRVIQGIVTGIGFLGAGVIIKDGFTISGLTTAASIWTASAIGVMVGIGFYAAAILLSVMSAIVMMWISKLERWLPSRHAITIGLTFQPNTEPDLETLKRLLKDCEFEIAWGSLTIGTNNNKQKWHFVAIPIKSNANPSISSMSGVVQKLAGLEDFHLSFARN
jgi:putative Mg2+ transporter-C (MgtC) family protein